MGLIPVTFLGGVSQARPRKGIVDDHGGRFPRWSTGERLLAEVAA